MGALWDATEFNERYGKRLAIVVPYRDRAEHLAAFLMHMTAYFQRDKLDRHITHSIHIVEQLGNGPFNRGKLLNCGCKIVGDTADYVCFHDVDYLPLWADYSWTPRPARLLWHGLVLKEDWDSFFGGVVLFDKPAFERVNGYPNGYWGWGHEDLELGQRCKLMGFDLERRDGTYQGLPHPHAGFIAPGVYSEEGRRTRALYESRRERIRELIPTDGLSSLAFETVKHESIQVNGSLIPNAFHDVVDIGEPGD
jgi:hypothetical protein